MANVPPAKPKKKWLMFLDVSKRLVLSAGKIQNIRNNTKIIFSCVGDIIYYLEEEIYNKLE